MSLSVRDVRPHRRLMARTAAAMYGAAALDGVVEGLLPGHPGYSLVPVFAVLALFVALLAVGPRLPLWALAAQGPLGVVLIAYALATTAGPQDTAVLYALPVVWTTLFFGRRGAVAILGCVAVGHALALRAMTSGGYADRWVDVMVSAVAISVVVLSLERRNRQLVDQLHDEARTDPLTGLLNRRGFDERAAIAVAHARRAPEPVAVATFDLDFFKHVNDEWGHEVGDRVLHRTGTVLGELARDIDITARFGGEEFVALLPATDAAGADAFTQRARSALNEPDPDGLPAVRFSAGVAASATQIDVQALLYRADRALYEAKRSGRNRTAIDAPVREPAPLVNHGR